MTSVDISDEAEEELAQLRSSSSRADAVVNGLLWDLERNPMVYEVLPGTGVVRCAEARPFPDVPMMRCYYVYDESADSCRILNFLQDEAAE